VTFILKQFFFLAKMTLIMKRTEYFFRVFANQIHTPIYYEGTSFIGCMCLLISPILSLWVVSVLW